MKRNFGDHSANERTFLAWIRTAIAIMAFGFLVEKFTIFLDYISQSLHQPKVGSWHGAATLGLGLVILGTIMIVLSTWRFKALEREIDKDEPIRSFLLPDLLLALLLAFVGLFLIAYLMHRMFF